MELVKFKQQLDSIPKIIEENSLSHQRAINAGKAFIEKAKEQGMDDQLDQEANNLLKKLKVTVKKMKDKRMPVTKLFDDFKKQFTAQENDIDTKGDVYSIIQKMRDDLAAKKLQEQREREREAMEEKQRKDEQTSVKYGAIKSAKDALLNLIEDKQAELSQLFESTKLSNKDKALEALKNFDASFTKEMYEKTSSIARGVAQYRVLSKEEANEIVNRELDNPQLYKEFADDYSETLISTKEIFIDKFPGKVKELEDMEKADAEKRKEMEAEALRRKEKEEERIRQEKLRRQQEEEERLRQEKAKAELNNSFEAMATSTGQGSTATVTEGFQIEVLNAVGYMEIANFYFKNKGLKEAPANLAKKNLLQMKKFAEDWAKKEGETIESNNLIYNSIVKTQAR